MILTVQDAIDKMIQQVDIRQKPSGQKREYKSEHATPEVGAMPDIITPAFGHIGR